MNQTKNKLSGEALRLYKCHKGFLQACRNEGEDGKEEMLLFMYLALEQKHSTLKYINQMIKLGEEEKNLLGLYHRVDDAKAEIEALLQIFKEEF